MLDRDLSRRTPAEEVWLWRKSKGLTGPEAASRLGMGRTSLWRRETGAIPLHQAPRKITNPPLPLVLRLARRRTGMSLRGVAKALGISHQTLLKWEGRGEEALVEWWRRRGWTGFPEGRLR